MSTKTTFKRIALVTVAALGLSLVAVAPSTAAFVNTIVNTNFNCFVANDGTGDACSTLAGPANYVTVKATSLDVYVVLTGGTFTNGSTATTITAGSTANISASTVGTVTAKGYAISSGVASATAQTVTITVADAAAAALAVSRAAGTYYERSTAFINTTTASEATADSSGIISPKAASATPVARITVKQYSTAVGAVSTVLMAPASAKLVTVAVVGGAGYVSTAADGTLSGPSSSVTADESSDFYVYRNGNSGTASVTVTVNGVLVSTKTVTFYGTASALTPAVATTVLGTGPNTAAVKVTATDSFGNIVPNTPVYMVSDTSATVASVSLGSTGVDGTLTAAITGAAVGTASLSFANGSDSTATGYVVSSGTAVRVSDSTPTAVALAFDKDSYLPGEVATVTATLTNAAGPVPAKVGGYTVLAAGGITSSLVLTSGATLAAINTVITPTGNAGAQSFTVNMPLSAGTVTLSATGASGITVTGATATVAIDSTAADAAAEATDAANAATDAANAAAEAADAATAAAQDAADAVAALSAQVATLIAGLKAQLTALTNLVIKIQKKVKA